MRNLNNMIDPALGWILIDARAINASGQIVGWGAGPAGGDGAFLLTPTSAQVPLPAALPLLAAALGGLALLRRNT
jgi:hypothetical protein